MQTGGRLSEPFGLDALRGPVDADGDIARLGRGDPVRGDLALLPGDIHRESPAGTQALDTARLIDIRHSLPTFREKKCLADLPQEYS